MGSNVPLNQVYTHSMKNYPYGYALYQSTSSTLAQPGACGFIDARGNWCRLFELEEVTLESLGLSKPKDSLIMAPKDINIRWGPQPSHNLKAVTLDSKIGVEEAATHGLAKAKAIMKYTSTSDSGALLLTSPSVHQEGYSSESPIKNWYKTNLPRLTSPDFKFYDDIAEHGLFVITQTHSTKRCSLIAWHSNKKDVFLGLDAGAAGAAEVGVHGRWATSEKEGGWNHYHSLGNDRRVVFICGLLFRTRRMLGITHTNVKTAEQLTRNAEFRAQNEIEVFVVEHSEGEFSEVEVERFGHLPDPVEYDDEDEEELD